MRSTHTHHRCNPTNTHAWSAWQQEIVALLDQELGEILGEVHLNDVDWPAWRPLYEEGRSAKAALDRAFERISDTTAVP